VEAEHTPVPPHSSQMEDQDGGAPPHAQQVDIALSPSV